jgi:4-amino-4-deoxy-L-arabinose transferase-like glycosyltransferase
LIKGKVVSLGIPLLLFLIACAVRIIYLYQAESNDPMFKLALPSLDMHEYDITARQYLKGNFDFSARESLPTSAFYPFVLMLFYKMSGSSQHLSRIAQIIISSATVALLYGVAGYYMRRPFAILCGVMLCFYGVAIFYSAILLPGTVILFSYVLALWLTTRYWKTQKRVFALLASLALGVCIIARPSHICMLPFFLACLLLKEPYPTRQRWTAAALALVGTCGVLALWALKDVALGVERQADYSIGLYGVLIGNTHDAMGLFYYCPASANEILAYSGGNYLIGIFELIKDIFQHPIQWILMELRKFGAFWVGFEAGNNVDYYESRRFSSLLSLPLVSFGLLSGMGISGMIIGIKRLREFAPLYLMSAGAFLSVFLFVVLSRYRLIILPTLIIFGGLAIEQIWELLSSRRYKAAGKVIAVVAILLLLTRSSNIRFLYPDSFLDYFESMAKHNIAIAYITDGNPAIGASELERLIESNPHFAEAYVTLAVFLESQGKSEEALNTVRAGLKVAPSNKALLAMQQAENPHPESPIHNN